MLPLIPNPDPNQGVLVGQLELDREPVVRPGREGAELRKARLTRVSSRTRLAWDPVSCLGLKPCLAYLLVTDGRRVGGACPRRGPSA